MVEGVVLGHAAPARLHRDQLFQAALQADLPHQVAVVELQLELLVLLRPPGRVDRADRRRRV